MNKLHRPDRRFSDARLPDTLYPPQESVAATGYVMLTGATGFLGSRVLESLLRETTLSIICLVRGTTTETATQRLQKIMAFLGVDETLFENRVSVIKAHIEKPLFGLDSENYRTLARQVQHIYHCAAEVNWVKPYAQLRTSHVTATLEIIQFACAEAASSVTFVSSIASCYLGDTSTSEREHSCEQTNEHAPKQVSEHVSEHVSEQINEYVDNLERIDQMPLAYAQAKCVAEQLFHQIAKHGLPVTILRPSLLSGDTRSGASSTDDLTAALLDSAIRSGIVSNADWQLDHVPVDYLANLITRLPVPKLPVPKKHDHADVIHVINPRPRRWRELTLWLQLYGHELKQLSEEDWLQRIFSDRALCGERLYTYRRLFLGRQADSVGSRPYRVYLEPGQQAINSSVSHARLESRKLTPPVLEPKLLHRYLNWYECAGVVPRRATHEIQQAISIKNDLQHHLPTMLGHSAVEPPTLTPLTIYTDSGFLSALASATTPGIGLSSWRVAANARNTSTSPQDIVCKTRSEPSVLFRSAQMAATKHNSALGKLFEQHNQMLEIPGSLEREHLLYSFRELPLQRYIPRYHGHLQHPNSAHLSVVVQRIPKQYFPADSEIAQPWNLNQLYQSISALTACQAITNQQRDTLLERGVLSRLPDINKATAAIPLWNAMIDLLETESKSMPHQKRDTDYLIACCRVWINQLSSWWPNYHLQADALVHNDFNPRNLAGFNQAAFTNAENNGPYIIDWEMAGIGVPQRDLAELLCFSIDTDNLSQDNLQELILKHHEAYCLQRKVNISADLWQSGFHHALRHFAITRLPLYALVNYFRPLQWLPTVLHKTATLVRLTDVTT